MTVNRTKELKCTGGVCTVSAAANKQSKNHRPSHSAACPALLLHRAFKPMTLSGRMHRISLPLSVRPPSGMPPVSSPDLHAPAPPQRLASWDDGSALPAPASPPPESTPVPAPPLPPPPPAAPPVTQPVDALPNPSEWRGFVLCCLNSACTSA